MKRTPVKVYLSKPELEMLDRITSTMEQDRSGVLRTAFLAYAKDLSLIREQVHSPPGDRPL